MNEIFVSLIGSPEVIETVSKNVAETNDPLLEISAPTPMESALDVLDSPLNPTEVTQLLQSVSIILSTGTAAFNLATAIFNALKARREAKVILQDAKTGKKIAEITHEMSLEQLERLITQ